MTIKEQAIFFYQGKGYVLGLSYFHPIQKSAQVVVVVLNRFLGPIALHFEIFEEVGDETGEVHTYIVRH